MIQQPSAADARQSTGSTGPAAQVDDWIAIEPDGTVTAYSGKVELGTGVRTALAQIVAEELDVPFERVRMVMGDTARTPNEGYTAGSKTIRMSGSALRQASAEARLALLEMASERLDASVEELTVDNGVISVHHYPSRQVTYAELMGGKRFHRAVGETTPVKRPGEYRVVGQPIPRADLPDKLTGVAGFIHDVRLPGMLHGRVVHPPSLGAQLVSLDASSINDEPGVVRIVHHGNFVGVVAEREEQAVRAAQKLKIQWHESPHLPAMSELYDYIRRQPTTNQVVTEKGDPAAQMNRAARRVSAIYLHPFQAHAAIASSCAVADFHDGHYTVWTSSQGVYPLRGALAQLLEAPLERVRVVHVEGAGSFGQNGADDVAADAAVLARAVGRPVRVQWSREDEFAWEPYASAMVIQLQAGLDEQGNVIAWQYESWTPNHSNRPKIAENLLAAQLIAEQTRTDGRAMSGGARNAPTNYSFPDQRVEMHWLAASLLRASSFRSLGATQNTFANESFMDELAHAARLDPVEFRLRHLDDPRARDVLQAAVVQADWNKPRPAGIGRGIAFACYNSNEAYVATVAEVQVDPASGTVRARRIVVAHDCGLIINPDGLRNQIEGNVIQSASRALKEEVKFDQARVTSLDWQTYPILTFSEIPAVEIVLLNRPEEKAMGAGEPSTVTTAPAIANAIFDACGKRVRQIPFTPERVRATPLTSS